MKDRIPGAPGRYSALVSSEEVQNLQEGKQFAITLTRDDDPVVEGTPYSKAAVLPDELAAVLCPDLEDPAPKDAFAALSTDFIVAQGVSGDWTYRKWASGVAECWGVTPAEPEYCISAGPLFDKFHTGGVSVVTPFAFLDSEEPIVNVGVSMTDGTPVIPGEVYVRLEEQETIISPNFYVYYPDSNGDGYAGEGDLAGVVLTVTIHVIGRWK